MFVNNTCSNIGAGEERRAESGMVVVMIVLHFCYPTVFSYGHELRSVCL